MRAAELGSVAALAAELGVSERSARRWASGQLPRKWDEARLVRFATELYAQSHRADVRRSPAERRALERALDRPSYSPRAMTKAVARIRRELRRLARERGESRRLPSELAADLGATTGQLRGWLRRGRVPETHMRQFDAWAQARADEEFQAKVEKERAKELIQQAKEPALAPRLSGERGPRRRAARAPDVRTSEGEAESEAHAGYVWNLRVEAWLSPALIDKMARWALGRRRETKNRLPAPRWVVTALCSVLLSPGSKGTKSPGGRRHFSRVSDRAFGSRLELGSVFGSGTVKRGGLEVAVSRFEDALTEQLGEPNRVWVHAVIVRNWRVRGEREREAYRERQRARWAAEQRVLELRQERRKARARRQVARTTRAKVSGKRSTAKGAGRSRGGKRS